MTTRLRIGLAGLAFVLGLDLLALGDAHRRERSSSSESARAIVRIVGTADLALSSDARWLRHPSMAEPWAAVSDNPASLDTEPAGAIIGPPRP